MQNQEYVFEAEMEEAYRSSLLKAFNKTLNDGFFPMVIVDAINDKVCCRSGKYPSFSTLTLNIVTLRLK